MDSRTRSLRTALLLGFVVIFALVPAALAGKGGGGGKPPRGGGSTATGTFTLKLVESTDGVAHWSQHITFDVVSNAQYPFVAVSCYQGGVRVYRQDIGFYVGWPWSKDFTLMSYAWTGGAANCDAELYSQNSDGSNRQTLNTMTFSVAA